MATIRWYFLTFCAAVVSLISLGWYFLTQDEFYLVYSAFFFVSAFLAYIEHGKMPK